MKQIIEIAEKGLLLLLPYLLLLSLSYYWGYWGYFGIDAISYYGVQDLVKGFAFTSPSVIVLGCLAVFGFPIFNKFLDLQKTHPWWLLGGLAIALSIVLYIGPYKGYVGYSNENEEKDIPSMILFVLGFILPIIVIWLARAMGWLIKGSLKDYAAKYGLRLVVIFPICAYASGRYNAKDIIDNKYFAYTLISTDVNKPQFNKVFKYLGKAGEYYFFTSPDNNENHIIATQVLPTLTLYSFSKYDSASVRAYQAIAAKVK